MNNLKTNIILFFSLLTLNFVFAPAGKTTEIISSDSPDRLEKQAQNLYQQKNFEQAILLLKKAINEYKTKGQFRQTVTALSNLSLTYQQLGKWEQAHITLEEAEEYLHQIENVTQKNKLKAQILEVKGQIELSLGKSQNALSTWKQATNIYQQIKDINGITQTNIYQAQALQALGLYSQAIKTLKQIETQLVSKPDNLLKLQALNNLGNVLRRRGKYQEAESIFQSSLNIAQQLNAQQNIADIYFSLGNIKHLQSKPKQALELYQKAINTSTTLDIKLQSKLKQLDILIQQKQIAKANQLIPEIEAILNQLPLNNTAIQGQINLAHHLIAIETEPQIITNLLVTAIQNAQNLGIKRTEAEALGKLGNLYEKYQKLPEASQLTQQALIISQSINAKEQAYQWQWQLGRIYTAQEDNQKAILAYTQAVNNLQSIRSDLVAVSSDIQFSFREQIEPVYRQLATLLLQPNATQANLNQAREIIESLQLAELDNFFRDACIDTQPSNIEAIDTNTAIIYSIILGDRLEVIAAIPNQPLQHYTSNLTSSEIEIVITSANSLVSNPGRLNLKLLEEAYNWLIRPIEKNIESQNIQTIVFVSDGILRNLPPATFHNGEQYLIEKYSIAIAPSLRLVETQAKQKYQEVLIAGLSKSRQGFSPLPGVEEEINLIDKQLRARKLLNENFTQVNLIDIANNSSYPIVHLATHGQFSSNLEDTFILTWDERLNINELNSLLRADSKQLRPIELLVLSACETARGDKQAILGLAGIAVRAGARSTLASVWAVDDKATVTLMNNFYQELAQGNITKAEALRRAQLRLLENPDFSHPFYWSAFILVGNWL